MKRILIVAALLAAIPAICLSAPDPAKETIGVIRNATGTVSVTREGKAFPAVPGTRLHAEDVLDTGKDGSAGIILRDDSSLSVGPDTRLVLRQFLFAPAEGKFALLVRISRGTMAYISGLIGKLSPLSARFETPVATIGIRGTRFAVKVDD